MKTYLKRDVKTSDDSDGVLGTRVGKLTSVSLKNKRTLLYTSRPNPLGLCVLSGLTGNKEYKDFTTRTYANKLHNYPDWQLRIARKQDATTHIDLYGCTEIQDTTCGLMSDIQISQSWCKSHPASKRVVGCQGHLAKIPITLGTGDFRPSLKLTKRIPDALIVTRDRAYKKARDKFDSLNESTILATSLQTINGILHPLQGIQDFLKSFTQKVVRSNGGKRRRVKEVEKAIASTWIEWNFGWAPLLADLDTATVEFERKLFNLNEVRTTHRSVLQEQIEYEQNVKLGNLAMNIEQRALMSETLFVKVAVSQYLNETAADRLSNPINKLYEFVPTVWEVVPWSFFIDYFIPIGNMIDNTFARRYLSLQYAYETVKQTLEIDVKNLPRPFTATTLVGKHLSRLPVQGNSGSLKLKFESCTRTPIDVDLIRLDTRVKLPDYWKQIANMAALRVQLKDQIRRIISH